LIQNIYFHNIDRCSISIYFYIYVDFLRYISNTIYSFVMSFYCIHGCW